MRTTITNEDLRALAGYFRVAFWLRVLGPVLLAVGAILPASGLIRSVGTTALVILGAVVAVLAMFILDMMRSRAQHAGPLGGYVSDTGQTYRITPFGFPAMLSVWLLLGLILASVFIGSADAAGALAILAIYALPFPAALYEASCLRDAYAIAVMFRDDPTARLTRSTMRYMWLTFYVFSLAFGFTAIIGSSQNEIDDFMVIVSTPMLIPALLLWVRSLRCYARATRTLETTSIEDVDFEVWKRLV